MVRRTVPAALEQAVTKALAPTPADRFATPLDFTEALEHARAGPERVRFAPGLRYSRSMAWAGLVTAILLASGWWLSQGPNVRIDSLAVLPLNNLSGDSGQSYFADAMHGAVIGELGQIAALRVISQWSSSRYRDSGSPFPK